MPLPLPLPPEVIVIQGALLVAVQAQPAAVVTPTLPVPPLPGTDALVGEMLNEQAAAWVTVKVLPATVIVPVRGVVPVLGATE